MAENWYNDGFNNGYGQSYKNKGHDYPQTDGDKYSYTRGREDGERHRRISEELEKEGY